MTSSVVVYMVWAETEPLRLLSLGAPVAVGVLVLLLPPVETNLVAFTFWYIASGYVVVLSLLVIMHNRDGDPDVADEVS